MKAGDKVLRNPVTLECPHTAQGKKMPLRGTVVYIHPKGRYHTVAFQLRGGIVQESFLGMAMPR